MIQTYTPDNDVIRFAAGQDYDSFYEQEIQLRRLRDEPPFRDILVLTASGPDEAGVLRVCTRLRQFLERELPNCPISPSACWVPRRQSSPESTTGIDTASHWSDRTAALSVP